MSKDTRSDAVTIQAFAERMAVRSDESAQKHLDESNVVEYEKFRAVAVAFWIVRNYIEDTFLSEEGTYE